MSGKESEGGDQAPKSTRFQYRYWHLFFFVVLASLLTWGLVEWKRSIEEEPFFRSIRYFADYPHRTLSRGGENLAECRIDRVLGELSKRYPVTLSADDVGVRPDGHWIACREVIQSEDLTRWRYACFVRWQDGKLVTLRSVTELCPAFALDGDVFLYWERRAKRTPLYPLYLESRPGRMLRLDCLSFVAIKKSHLAPRHQVSRSLDEFASIVGAADGNDLLALETIEALRAGNDSAKGIVDWRDE